MTYTTRNIEEMYELAASMLPELLRARVVLLQGDLGSGKTTFAQGVGRALGIEGPMRSPTFTLVNVYDVEHDMIDRLVHTDFYRLDKVDDAVLRDLGLDEFMSDKRTLVLIEWPERADDLAGLHLAFESDRNVHTIKNITDA